MKQCPYCGGEHPWWECTGTKRRPRRARVGIDLPPERPGDFLRSHPGSPYRQGRVRAKAEEEREDSGSSLKGPGRYRRPVMVFNVNMYRRR